MNQKICAFLIFLFCFLSFNLSFGMEQKPIPLEQAFKFSVEPTNTDSVLANWQIEPGYYLYKDRFGFEVLSPKDADIGLIIKPRGIEQYDKILGKHYVYENQLSLSIPILNPTNQPMELLVHYQGCAKWGFCYPPVTKLVTIDNRTHLTANDIKVTNYKATLSTKAKSPTASKQTENVDFQSEQSIAENILVKKNWGIALILFFGFGVLLAFTPCVLPMVPILSGIIVGQGKDLKTKHAFGLSLSYVLGMAIAFAIAGLIIGLIGSSIQAALQTPWVLIIFSLIFVLLALSLFGFYNLQLPQSLQQKVSNLSNKRSSGSYIGVAIMGILSTLIVSPCVSAPLVGALAYIANTGNAIFGGLALFSMGLGMGLPLLIVGTSFGKILPKAGHWMNSIKNFFGVLLLGVAIWMLERILPGPFVLMLWALLAIVSSIYMGALNPTKENGWSKLWKGLGLALLLYGFLLLIGASMGNNNPFRPLEFNKQMNGIFSPTLTSNETVQKHNFIQVRSISDLEQQLAKHKGQLIMLDFYADWCVACKEMEINTFNNPMVGKALQNFVLLQADVTENNAADQALEKKYGVVAPPTILFFNKNGEEISSARVIGEMGAKDFLSHLNKIRTLSN